MALTSKNYFSPRANRLYFSASQVKQFKRCEAMAMAEIRGKYTRPASQALMVGSYVDAAGIPTHYGSVVLVNASVEYPLRHITLFLQLHNITNRLYCDHGGVPQPGATLLVGLVSQKARKCAEK